MHVPLFMQGFTEHGLKSVAQVAPVKYKLHSQTNLFRAPENVHNPLFEQLPRQSLTSAVLVNKLTNCVVLN